MEGILLVDKPEEWTSFDVVNYVRKIIAQDAGVKPRNIKVGHTGTLDPAAIGLLVLCIGKKYTRKVAELSKQDKTYIAEVTFGASSSTGDKEGEIVKDTKAKQIQQREIERVLKDFVGEQKQAPHAYSAVKVGGKRAYELARKGEEVNLKQRDITIHEIGLISYNWPAIQIKCSVSSGTYIRVLAEEIGRQLGVGAYMSDLCRLAVGSWSVEKATEVKELNIDIIKEKLLV